MFSKKLRPKSKNELRRIILNEDIELGSIDTSLITDMSHLFEPVLETCSAMLKISIRTYQTGMYQR